MQRFQITLVLGLMALFACGCLKPAASSDEPSAETVEAPPQQAQVTASPRKLSGSPAAARPSPHQGLTPPGGGLSSNAAAPRRAMQPQTGLSPKIGGLSSNPRPSARSPRMPANPALRKRRLPPQPADKKDPAALFAHYKKLAGNGQWADAARMLSDEMQVDLVRTLAFNNTMLYDVHGYPEKNGEPVILPCFADIWKKHGLPETEPFEIAKLVRDKPEFIADEVRLLTKEGFYRGNQHDLPYLHATAGPFELQGELAVATVSFPEPVGTDRKVEVAFERHGDRWLIGRPPAMRKMLADAQNQRQAELSELTPAQQSAVTHIESLGGNFGKEILAARLFGADSDVNRFTTLELGYLQQTPDDGLRDLADLTQLTSMTWMRSFGPKPGGGLQGEAGYCSDEMLAFVGRLPALEIVDLTFTPVTDKGIAHLAGLPAIKTLDLRATEITDGALPHLARLRTLQELDLGQTAVTKAGVERLARQLPRCRIQSDYDERDSRRADVGTLLRAA